MPRRAATPPHTQRGAPCTGGKSASEAALGRRSGGAQAALRRYTKLRSGAPPATGLPARGDARPQVDGERELERLKLPLQLAQRAAVRLGPGERAFGAGAALARLPVTPAGGCAALGAGELDGLAQGELRLGRARRGRLWRRQIGGRGGGLAVQLHPLRRSR